jgi:hypothetical protein
VLRNSNTASAIIILKVRTTQEEVKRWENLPKKKWEAKMEAKPKIYFNGQGKWGLRQAQKRSWW